MLLCALEINLYERRWKKQDWAEGETDLWRHPNKGFSWPLGTGIVFRGIMSWYEWLAFHLPTLIGHWIQSTPGRGHDLGLSISLTEALSKECWQLRLFASGTPKSKEGIGLNVLFLKGIMGRTSQSAFKIAPVLLRHLASHLGTKDVY